MAKKFIVIDSNSVMHRAYHALPAFTAGGVNTGAVYGFMSMLMKVLRQEMPDYVAACFDVKKRVFRHEFFEEYKAGRKKTDPELIEQFPIMKDFFKAMDIPVIEQEGFEADDLIGSICKKFQDVDTYVLTGDKDSLQLIDHNTFVLLMRKGISDVDTYDTAAFVEKYGVQPSQFVDVKALMGDKSDNIPGVTKVGEKTALRLIVDYGNLDGVYANLDKEKGKLKENLENDKDMAYLSQRLAQINCDIPMDEKLEDYSFQVADLEKSYGLMEKYNMKSLISRGGQSGAKAAATSPMTSAMTSAAADAPKELKIPGKRIKAPKAISNEATLRDAIGKLKPVPLYLAVMEDAIIFSDGTGDFTIGQQLSLFDDTMDKSTVLAALRLHMEEHGVITDDAKALYGLMDDHDICAKVVFDLSLAAYLVDSALGDYTLPSLVREYLASDIVSGVAMAYLHEYLAQQVEQYKQVYYDIELPLARVLHDMERAGFAVDASALGELSKTYRAELVRIQQEIFDVAGEEFNVNSPKQLSVILFEKLGLKSGKKTKTGYSTDADTLEKIREQSPIVDKVLEYRKYSKLIGTYIDGMLPLIEQDGRVHTVFLQKGTVTGRIASKEPNLQNIPVRTEHGREIRRAFVAKEGYTLLCADYSQIELRVLAHISGDPVMIDAFNKWQDIHARTASEVFGVAIEDVDSSMRRSAKAVNFGIVYGLSPYGLSTNLGIPFGVAKEYIDSYLHRYSRVAQYMTDVVEQAKIDGYVDTLLGRRRYVPQLVAKNRNMVAFGERVALNTPIQGTAADMIKLAMIKVHGELAKLDSRLILQVHDELIVETADHELEQVEELVRRCMEGVLELAVPVVVDVSRGKRWEK